METATECHYAARIIYRLKQILLFKNGERKAQTALRAQGSRWTPTRPQSPNPQLGEPSRLAPRAPAWRKAAGPAPASPHLRPTASFPAATSPSLRRTAPPPATAGAAAAPSPAARSYRARGAARGGRRGARSSPGSAARPAPAPARGSDSAGVPVAHLPPRRPPGAEAACPGEGRRAGSGGPAKFPGGAGRGAARHSSAPGPLPVLPPLPARLVPLPASPVPARPPPLLPAVAGPYRERSGVARRHRRRRGERCTPAGYSSAVLAQPPGAARPRPGRGGAGRSGGAARRTSATRCPLPPAPPAAVPPASPPPPRCPSLPGGGGPRRAGASLLPSPPSRPAPGLRGGSARPSLRRLRRAGGGSQR